MHKTQRFTDDGILRIALLDVFADLELALRDLTYHIRQTFNLRQNVVC